MTPDADRPVDDYDTWMSCDHDWKNGSTYTNGLIEQTCTKCGFHDFKDVS
jgi:hypothetical protein